MAGQPQRRGGHTSTGLSIQYQDVDQQPYLQGHLVPRTSSLTGPPPPMPSTAPRAHHMTGPPPPMSYSGAYTGHNHRVPREAQMTGPPPPMSYGTQSYGTPSFGGTQSLPPMSAPPMPRHGSDPSFRAAPPPPGPPGIVLRGSVDPRLTLLIEPNSSRSTAFRTLRDNLIAKNLPRIIAVSSPLKGDGKTTCALNLALALSEEARVLLLDGNLIEPHLHTVFGINENTRPSTAHGPWAAPYTVADYSNTFAIAALVLAPGTRPLFDRRWFEQLLGSLRRSHWDYIVIDSAAVTADPTVMQLVSTADGTLLCVRAGVTTGRALRRAHDQLPHGKALGVALIDTKPT
ncbi:MAG: CpsD/CapB family tyrosine-protein kinase [Labilithrix sp.]|nr:CpsD/CapB family tyrosine-protein kinase [Labilithrix sp.]MCW5811254.1 CpsD/CapB family tyrosine-protein kinase [Labilithrix sp.]